tara:strand:- start:251 stop:415 length:165 start_codon:yes stop_codon:yes gene_type:complete
MRRKNISNMFWNGVLKPRNPIAEELHKNKLFKPKIKKDKKKFDRKKDKLYLKDL